MARTEQVTTANTLTCLRTKYVRQGRKVKSSALHSDLLQLCRIVIHRSRRRGRPFLRVVHHWINFNELLYILFPCIFIECVPPNTIF